MMIWTGLDRSFDRHGHHYCIFFTAPVLCLVAQTDWFLFSHTVFYFSDYYAWRGERLKKVVAAITAINLQFIDFFLLILNAPLPQGTVSPFYDFSALMLRFSNQLQHMF